MSERVFVPPSRSDWPAIYKCTLLMLVCSLQILIFVPSLWPYLKTVDPGANESFFGVVVAVFGLSQIASALAVGWWSSRSGCVKIQLISCLAICTLGQLLLMFADCFEAHWLRAIILLSRLLAGTGLGQIPLLKSYVSTASLDQDRVRAQALINGGLTLGVVAGPALQVCFSLLSYPGISLLPGLLRLNAYTCPSLFSAFINGVMIALLFWGFEENQNGKPDHSSGGDPVAAQYDRWAVGVCCLLRFTHYFVFTCLETIGAMFAMLMFSFDPLEAVFWEGLAHALRGLITISVYVVYLLWDVGRLVSDRLNCLLSLLGWLLFFVLTFPWPFLPGRVALATNGTAGCNVDENTWCPGLAGVNAYFYYAMVVLLLGVTFSNSNVAMNTLFSRILGPRVQSKEQGWMEMCGGIGRLMGPLFISSLYKHFGPRIVWSLEMAVISFSALLWLLFYGRLVPLRSKV